MTGDRPATEKDMLYIIQRQAEALGKAEISLQNADKALRAMRNSIASGHVLVNEGSSVVTEVIAGAIDSVGEALREIDNRRDDPDAG